jgi:hypothetical protein
MRPRFRQRHLPKLLLLMLLITATLTVVLYSELVVELFGAP